MSLSGEEMEAVRQMVRELLSGVLPSTQRQPTAEQYRVAKAPAPAVSNGEAPIVESVAIRNDADLAAFVRRLLHLYENPKNREDVRRGRLGFKLDTPPSRGSYEPAHRIDKGAVTEKAVRDAARVGARLVLGPAAVLTPLAWDRARAEGVKIEKERA